MQLTREEKLRFFQTYDFNAAALGGVLDLLEESWEYTKEYLSVHSSELTDQQLEQYWQELFRLVALDQQIFCSPIHEKVRERLLGAADRL